MPESETVMVVDPTTGGVKGSKLARFDLLPPDVMWALAEHYGQGSKKYEDRNWEKGYDWGLSYAAAMRHANEFWAGHDRDEETGSLHVVAAAWHFIALAAFIMRGLGTDSRSGAPVDGPLRTRLDDAFLEAVKGLDPLRGVTQANVKTQEMIEESILRGIMGTTADYKKLEKEMNDERA